jgi:hypothetical protein
MHNFIVFVCCLSILTVNSASAKIEVYRRSDLEVSIDTKAYFKNTARNFDNCDSLRNSKIYDYWHNYVKLGITAKGSDWKTRFRLNFENMRDDDHAVMGDHQDGVIEIEEAFLGYRFPDLPFFCKAGRWEQSFGTEMFYGDENDTGLMFGYRAADTLIFTLGHFTNKETKRKRKDHNMSFIKADVQPHKRTKVSAFLVCVSEDVGYDERHPKRRHDVRLYNLGIYCKAKIDDFDLELEGNRQFGSCRDYVDEKDAIEKIDYKGYAVSAKGEVKIGNLRPAIILGYGSGDRRHYKKGKAYVGYASDYEPDNIVIDNGLAIGSRDTISNLMFIRFDLCIKADDKLTIIPGIGYYRHVKEIEVYDYVNVDDKKTKELVGLSDRIGTEIDLGLKYVINRYVYFRFSHGYLFTDEGIGIKNPDNAWKIEANVTVRF